VSVAPVGSPGNGVEALAGVRLPENPREHEDFTATDDGGGYVVVGPFVHYFIAADEWVGSSERCDPLPAADPDGFELGTDPDVKLPAMQATARHLAQVAAVARDAGARAAARAEAVRIRARFPAARGAERARSRRAAAARAARPGSRPRR